MIGFDIDNVILDFKKILHKYCLDNFNIDTNFENYHAPIPNRSKEEIDEIIEGLIIDNCDTIEPLFEVKEYLELFYNYIEENNTHLEGTSFNPEGVKIPSNLIFVTSRSSKPNISYCTFKSIQRVIGDIPFVIWHDMEPKRVETLNHFNYFVDDRIENLLPALNLGYIKKGFLVNNKWNENFEEPKGIIRVDNLKETWDYFCNLERVETI